MELTNQPFAPPTCPADKYGEPFTLSPEQFRFRVHDINSTDFPGRRATEFFGSFTEADSVTEENYNGNLVETDAVELPVDTEAARRAHEVGSDEEAIRRVGALLCQRVRVCHGVVDGECWALGARGVIEAVYEAGEA